MSIGAYSPVWKHLFYLLPDNLKREWTPNPPQGRLGVHPVFPWWSSQAQRDSPLWYRKLRLSLQHSQLSHKTLPQCIVWIDGIRQYSTFTQPTLSYEGNNVWLSPGVSIAAHCLKICEEACRLMTAVSLQWESTKRLPDGETEGQFITKMPSVISNCWQNKIHELLWAKAANIITLEIRMSLFMTILQSSKVTVMIYHQILLEAETIT